MRSAGRHQKRAKPDRREAVDFVGLAFVPDKFQGRDRGELEAGGNRGGIEPMRRTSTQPRYLRKHGDARIKRVVIIAPIAPFLLQTEDNSRGVPEALLAARKRQIGEDFPKWIDDNADPWVVKEPLKALVAGSPTSWFPRA